MTAAPSRGVVLIVEDSLPTRRGIERIIEKRFVPRGCGSFEEAIQAIDELQAPPVALILDVNLGSSRGDGLDIGQYAIERFHRHIPTLVLTGSTLMSEITERAARLRAELLVKPQSSESIQLFLDRAAVKTTWGAPDVLDLDREMQRFASHHHLTPTQSLLLFRLMRAAERGERAGLNQNTRKAGLRRILRRTGHPTFEALRHAVKQLARGEAAPPPQPALAAAVAR